MKETCFCRPRHQQLFVTALTYLVVLLMFPTHSIAQNQPADPKSVPQANAPVPAREGDKIGWHVVRQGECLENITKDYLGYRSLWRENWRLNPDIENPNRLKPGQRIRIILERQDTKQSAQVVKIRRQVERQTIPNPWVPAAEGDELVERDSLRTFKNAFSELLFQDGSTLNITEESMIFLRTVGQNLVGIHREAVEIINGQADLKAHFKTRKRSDIEIILGDAQARPQPDAEGQMATRNRMRQQGQAEVMVFSGIAQVESAGETVDVHEGMGTVVSQGEAPKPPTQLLPKPKLLIPASGEKFNYRNPKFSWESVPGATQYTLEVFDDELGSQLISRDTGIVGTQRTASRLPKGPLFWKVTASDALGLDGFPSAPRPFEIVGNLVDTSPPVVVALRLGSGLTEADAMILGPGASIKIYAHDDASGVASIRYRWNGNSWEDYRQEQLTLPDGLEKAKLEFQAIDENGAWSKIQSISVSQDLSAPDSPSLRQ